MLMRWYGVSQFYDNKMEITLWYEENEEPIWFFYFITYILYPISLWKGSGIASVVRRVANTAIVHSRGQCDSRHVRLYRYHKQHVLL